MTMVRDQLFFPKKPPGSRFRFSRTGVQPSPGSSTIELPSAFAANLVRTHLIENYRALRDSAPCLSRAATLPKATKLELGRGAHLKTPSSANHTAAASQPTGRFAKAASWLHLSLEGEPGPTPAGKILPHSYPETRFRRERTRYECASSFYAVQKDSFRGKKRYEYIQQQHFDRTVTLNTGRLHQCNK